MVSEKKYFVPVRFRAILSCQILRYVITDKKITKLLCTDVARNFVWGKSSGVILVAFFADVIMMTSLKRCYN